MEETVIIAGYDEVERFISPNTKWKHEFENAFFERGLGLLADYLDEINIIRKAKELPLIELKKTNVYDYARDPDRATKIEARTNIRRELRGRVRSSTLSCSISRAPKCRPLSRLIEHTKNSKNFARP